MVNLNLKFVLATNTILNLSNAHELISSALTQFHSIPACGYQCRDRNLHLPLLCSLHKTFALQILHHLGHDLSSKRHTGIQLIYRFTMHLQ